MTFNKIEHAVYPNTINIFAYTANICNLSCAYCSFSHFISSDIKTPFLDLDVLENFIINLYTLRQQDIYVELIGGEPTLDKKIIKFSNNINKYYPNIRVGLYTNFSLDISLYQELVKNNTNITITWHSLKSESFNSDFINKLNLLPYESFLKTVDVHVMYEPDNIEESISIFKLIKDRFSSTELRLLDHNFETFLIYFLENTFYTPDQISLYNETINTYQTLNCKKKTIKTTSVDKTINYYDVYDIYRNKEFYTFKNWLCDAGYNYLYIDNKGNIFPCLKYCEEKTRSIGTIYDINSLLFKKNVCKFNTCSCAWEVTKINLLNYKNK